MKEYLVVEDGYLGEDIQCIKDFDTIEEALEYIKTDANGLLEEFEIDVVHPLWFSQTEYRIRYDGGYYNYKIVRKR